jgi:sugar (pentulose or hexulose) kinase
VTFLALEVGTPSVTAAVWGSTGLVSVARAPAGDSPRSWWAGVEAAVGALDADLVEVEAVGCSAAEDLWVLLARDGEPLPVLASSGMPLPDAEGVRQRTGVLAAERSLPARLAASDLSRVGWVAHARDFVASLLTGRLASDPTAASASGFFTTGGELDAAVVAAAGIDADWLPRQQGSTEVLGDLLLPAARRLGLRSRLPVVMGAVADVCAVEGAGAVAPLVTYGAGVSVPVEPPAPSPLPVGVSLRAGGRSYQVLVAPAVSVDEVAAVAGLLAPDATFLLSAGDAPPSWGAALATTCGLPVVHRRSAEHATLGLAMLTATGAGAHLDRDEANPIAYADEPRLA